MTSKIKFYSRILISPIIYNISLLIIFMGLIFPTTLIIIISIVRIFNCIGVDFINLFLNKKLIKDDTLIIIDHFDNQYLNHILGLTILIWLPFYISYDFIKNGKLPKI